MLAALGSELIRAGGGALRNWHWATGAWLLAGALGSVAAAPPDRCAGSANEAALLSCRQNQLNSANNRLRQMLDKLRQRYENDEPQRWKLLAASQETWRAFSQAECRFRTYESASGSAYQVYLLACLAELTELRLKDLDAIVANP